MRCICSCRHACLLCARGLLCPPQICSGCNAQQRSAPQPEHAVAQALPCHACHHMTADQQGLKPQAIAQVCSPQVVPHEDAHQRAVQRGAQDGGGLQCRWGRQPGVSRNALQVNRWRRKCRHCWRVRMLVPLQPQLSPAAKLPLNTASGGLAQHRQLTWRHMDRMPLQIISPSPAAASSSRSKARPAYLHAKNGKGKT